jgi:hypothetical protein
MKHMESEAAAETQTTQTTLAAQRQLLAANWGTNYETNLFIARQAATALGITPEIVQTLENQIGYDKVMEFLRNVGVRIGEDKYISTPGAGGNNKVMTREQAVARVTELKQDKDWVARYLRGDKKEFDEMTALNQMIAGQQQR